MSFNSKLTSIKNTIQKVENSLNNFENEINKKCNFSCNCCFLNQANEDKRIITNLKNENLKKIDDIRLVQNENLYLNTLFQQINYKLSQYKINISKRNKNEDYEREFNKANDILSEIRLKIEMTSIYNSNKKDEFDEVEKAKKELLEKLFFLYRKYNKKSKNESISDKNDVVLIWKWLKRLIFLYKNDNNDRNQGNLSSKSKNKTDYNDFLNEVMNEFKIDYEEFVTLVKHLLKSYIKKE